MNQENPKVKESKPKKKIILISTILSLVVLVGVVIAVVLSVRGCSKNKDIHVANLSVKTFVCDSTGERNWVKNDFKFNQNDISKSVDTTPAIIQLELNEYVKHEYVLENVTDHTINYSIKLEDKNYVNYSLKFSIDNKNEVDFTGYYVGTLEAGKKVNVSFYLRIINTDIPASFDTKFYFTLSM